MLPIAYLFYALFFVKWKIITKIRYTTTTKIKEVINDSIKECLDQKKSIKNITINVIITLRSIFFL